MTPELICATVAAAYQVKPQQLRYRSNAQEFCRPRQVAMYFLQLQFEWSTPRIGRFFGGFDHATVINGIKAVQRRMRANADEWVRVMDLARSLQIAIPAIMAEQPESPESPKLPKPPRPGRIPWSTPTAETWEKRRAEYLRKAGKTEQLDREIQERRESQQ